MLDYPALAALSAVIRSGTFDAAGKALSVTPSAVSQRVKGLEERLGLPLVIRDTPCRPTDAGVRLLAHFDRVSLLEHDMFSEGAPWAKVLDVSRPTLKVAVNSDSMATWVPAAAANFGTASSSTLTLVLDDENRTSELLRRGEVIAAVTTTSKPVAGCHAIPLGAMRYIAIASPSFRDRHFAAGVTAKRLADAPVLRFDPHDELQKRWIAKAVGSAVEGPTHSTPSTQGMLDFTLAGVAWSLTPETVAAPFLVSGRLVQLKRGLSLEVPLFWQHLRIDAHTLDLLTRAVRTESKRWLV